MIRDGLVVHRTRYPHPVPAVWEALTDPAALAAWLMPNDFAPVVGHRFRLDSRPGFDVIEAEVLDVEPRHLLRCRWTIDGVPTTVTFRLEADGDGTVLELEHARLTTRTVSGFDGGWVEKMERDLGLVLSGARDRTRVAMDDGLHRHTELESERRARAERSHHDPDPTEGDA